MTRTQLYTTPQRLAKVNLLMLGRTIIFHWGKICYHYRWLAFRHQLGFHLVSKIITAGWQLIIINQNLFKGYMSVILAKFVNV